MALIGASIDILSNNLLANVIEIIKEAKAKEKVYLVSPYLQLNTNLRDVLEKAVKEGAEVRLICRKGHDFNDEDRKFFGTSNLNIRSLDHLHAKLYVNETVALVTSLNLYNYSDKESRELGILVSDYKYVKNLFDIAEEWWEKADKVDKAELILGVKKTNKSITGNQTNGGVCIRCGKSKSYNPKYPHCDDCFKKWAEYQNDAYPEKFCHKCGKQVKTTKRDPLCKTCLS
jgi:phosphatidylserine/phosphatidylglycerophosphate/cardiolipin synthase-like enzyme